MGKGFDVLQVCAVVGHRLLPPALEREAAAALLERVRENYPHPQAAGMTVEDMIDAMHSLAEQGFLSRDGEITFPCSCGGTIAPPAARCRRCGRDHGETLNVSQLPGLLAGDGIPDDPRDLYAS